MCLVTPTNDIAVDAASAGFVLLSRILGKYQNEEHLDSSECQLMSYQSGTIEAALSSSSGTRKKEIQDPFNGKVLPLSIFRFIKIRILSRTHGDYYPERRS